MVVPRRYGALNGSTTTGMPSSESSKSPSAARSKPRPYWKPEQPPPWIATQDEGLGVVLLRHQLPDLRRGDGVSEIRVSVGCSTVATGSW